MSSLLGHLIGILQAHKVVPSQTPHSYEEAFDQIIIELIRGGKVMKMNEAASEDPHHGLVPCRMWLLKINHEHGFCATWTLGLFSKDVERLCEHMGRNGCYNSGIQVPFATDEMEEVVVDAILQGGVSHVSEVRWTRMWINLHEMHSPLEYDGPEGLSL